MGLLLSLLPLYSLGTQSSDWNAVVICSPLFQSDEFSIKCMHSEALLNFKLSLCQHFTYMSMRPPFETSTIGIGATSGIFPMTPGPSQGRYHIHHFYLMMEYCCTHSALGFGGLDHAQFVMGSSDPVVIWWPMVKHLVSTKAQ